MAVVNKPSRFLETLSEFKREDADTLVEEVGKEVYDEAMIITEVREAEIHIELRDPSTITDIKQIPQMTLNEPEVLKAMEKSKTRSKTASVCKCHVFISHQLYITPI
jgi:hypothetical protein